MMADPNYNGRWAAWSKGCWLQNATLQLNRNVNIIIIINKYSFTTVTMKLYTKYKIRKILRN